jgi:hypothetical protein
MKVTLRIRRGSASAESRELYGSKSWGETRFARRVDQQWPRQELTKAKPRSPLCLEKPLF